jgi:hypothetical protein
MEVKDYLSDESNDLIIRSGDFAIGESTEQHQKRLLLANKGAYKQHPTLGVALNTYLLDARSITAFKGEVTKEFSEDGMLITSITMTTWEDFNAVAEYDKDAENIR